jgi:DMATS type aromatic prenyltransferase
VTTTPPRPVAERTFLDYGREKLEALTGALWPAIESNSLSKALQLMLRPWGTRAIGSVPRYRSSIADDEAPYEFCLALSHGPPEIQFYVEPQGDPPTLETNLQTARAVLDAAAAEFGATLDGFRAIEDLFLPSDPEPPFGLWIGASWKPGAEVLLKAYLNPRVRGRERAVSLVAGALERLGLGQAWSAAQSVVPLHDGRAELGLVCLDLSPRRESRLKVYVRHHRATLSEIQAVARLTREHTARDVEAFYATLQGSSGSFLKKPPITEITFVGAQPSRPSSITLEYPIGSYVDTDEAARARVVRCLTAFGLSPGPYDRAIRGFASRPLDAHAGLHAHVTLRQLTSGPRIAVYLASEAYGAQSSRR